MNSSSPSQSPVKRSKINCLTFAARSWPTLFIPCIPFACSVHFFATQTNTTNVKRNDFGARKKTADCTLTTTVSPLLHSAQRRLFGRKQLRLRCVISCLNDALGIHFVFCNLVSDKMKKYLLKCKSIRKGKFDKIYSSKSRPSVGTRMYFKSVI